MADPQHPPRVCRDCGRQVTPDVDCTEIAAPENPGPILGYFCDACMMATGLDERGHVIPWQPAEGGPHHG